MPANYRQALKEFVEQTHVIISSQVEESGPEHQKLYKYTFFLKESPSDSIWTPVPGEFATSKKIAEENASKNAVKTLEIWYRRA